MEPLQDQNLPHFSAAEIGKPYDLHSPYGVGANRDELKAIWLKENRYLTVKSDERITTPGYDIGSDLSLHIANVTVDDAGYYKLRLSYQDSFETTSDSIQLIPFSEICIVKRRHSNQ